MTTRVYIDGASFAPESAKVSVFDRGFLYGDSVFETLRTYGGRAFALSAHLERLCRSAARVHIDLSEGRSFLANEVERALAEAGNPESYVRLTITRGIGVSMGLDPGLGVKSTRVLIVSELKALPREFYERGIAVVTFATSRVTDASGAAGAKIGNYLTAVLAQRQAKLQSAEEALIVDGEGRILEGASSNVFALRDGKLLTAGEELGILAGITRDCVLRLAQDLKISVAFAAVSVADLPQLDELFICSSLREIVPVVRVDGQPIGRGVPGKWTRELRRGFLENISKFSSL